MSKAIRYLCILCYAVCTGFQTCAQVVDPGIYDRYNIYRNPGRVALNKISWNLKIGYANTAYNHDLKGFYYYQDDQSQYIIPNTGETLPDMTTGYTNWLNDPGSGDTVLISEMFDIPFDLDQPIFNPRLSPEILLLDGDTANLGYEGFGNGIPISLSAHYQIRDFRVGLGWTYEQHWLRKLTPTSMVDQVRDYEPDFKTTRLTRFFGLLGYKFYEFWDHDFVAEVQVGKTGYGPDFSDALSRGMYVNVGMSIEQKWSQYFRVILKPSYDFKKYTINVPGGNSVSHRQNAFLMQVGVSVNFPEIPRSPIKSDHVQLKHVITDPATGRLMEVRGQSIFKKQNPKVGQNHRKLFRYRFRNKRKLNPY